MARQQAADPRRIVVEKEGNRMLASALLTVRLGSDRAGAKVTPKDHARNVVAQSDVASALAVFCRESQNDPACGRAAALTP